jgi:hypothetical protein
MAWKKFWLVALAFMGESGIAICLAQELPPAPTPVPNAPGTPISPGAPITAGPSSPVAPPQPVPAGPLGGPYAPVQPGFIPPPPPPPPGYFVNPYPDANGRLLRGDPLLEIPPNRPPGWFGGIEADLVWPHIKNRVTGSVMIDDFIDTLHLPTASLDFTGSPKIILGYRLPPGFGEFTASYRSIVTEGTRNVEDLEPLGDSFLKSRLNVNAVDLDYGTQEIPLSFDSRPALWDFKFDVGARIAGVYFDSTSQGVIFHEHTSNNFFGAGPHVALQLQRHLADYPGISLFARIETAVVIGRIHQVFQESASFDGTPIFGGSNSQSGDRAVPVLGFQAGASWTPVHNWRWLQFSGGYTFEQWWDVGKVGGSSADLTSQGIFLRTELHF